MQTIDGKITQGKFDEIILLISKLELEQELFGEDHSLEIQRLKSLLVDGE